MSPLFFNNTYIPFYGEKAERKIQILHFPYCHGTTGKEIVSLLNNEVTKRMKEGCHCYTLSESKESFDFRKKKNFYFYFCL